MPAGPVTVNLLEHDEFTESPIGRIVAWATTNGRYIMILTEIIVLLAFVSRFSLDRKLTDLNESIEQKRVILEANQSFENDLKNLQKKLARINSIIVNQAKPLDVITQLKNILPPDVYLDTYTYSENSVTAKVVAGTTEGFGIFINNLQTVKPFVNVEIGEIKKVPLHGIDFSITAHLVSEKIQNAIENETQPTENNTSL